MLCTSAQYWAKDFGGTGGDRIADVKVDAQDNVYVIGEFSVSMEFDEQTLVSPGGTDAFVAKVDAAGSLVWMKRAGGTAIDRGLKLVVDDNGTLAVIGQFMGNANLFGTTIASAGGTMDVFVAKLDAATGDAAWVRTAGSPQYIDRPYGVSISPNGNITVVGEFRGTAAFGAQSLTSVPFPTTAQPSQDVFVASYSPTGNLLWLQQGAAEFSDRAIDVVSDAQSNLYVCGQFSDTVAFDAVHNNAMSNATFIIKLDAAGNEQWFRRCGGAAFDHVRDMLLTSTNELLICGDLEGTMVYADAVPTVISSGEQYAYYLLRVNLDGELIASEVMPSQNPVSAKAIDQRADTVAVFGEFDCQLSGLSEHYDGSGLFMAVGDPDLFIARHSLADLTVRDAQQFAGHQDKVAGGICSLLDGSLVFGGAYVELLFIPALAENPYWTDWPWFWVGTAYGCRIWNNNGDLGTYCDDQNYGTIGVNWSAGLFDAILARAYVRNRSPFDMWERTPGGNCDRSWFEPCIHRSSFEGCPDTIRLCSEPEEDTFSIIDPGLSPFSWAPYGVEVVSFDCLEGHSGFEVDFLWSNGATGNQIGVTEGGWYWCTVSTRNGCWSWTDSVYAVPYDFPCPEVNDQLGVNVDACPALDLDCIPPTWLWCENAPSDATVYWEFQTTINNDSVLVDQSYHVHTYFTTPDGCFNENDLWVTIDPDVDIPNVTNIDLEFLHEGEVLNGDTVVLCRYEYGGGPCTITWYIDGVESPNPGVGWFNGDTNCDDLGPQPAADGLWWCVYGDEEGWQDVFISANYNDGECGNQAFPFAHSDSIYVKFLEPLVSIAGPSIICPGDTIPITTTCIGCDSIFWASDAIVGLSDDLDTAWVNAPGFVTVFGFAISDGLICSEGPYIYIEAPEGPSLFVEPSVVCPGETALIYTDMQGTNLAWLGPDGPIASQNDSIWTNVTGDYYLSLTDQYGCEVGNGPLTLNLASSPYMDVTPSVILCPYESATLEVFSNEPESIQWNPPLSGNSPTQVVTEGGVYSCSVTSCGTTYTLSVEILAGTPDATVDGSPFLLCAGEQIELEGPPDQMIYYWEPMGEYVESIIVDQTGDYQLIVFDEFGCSDTSEVLHVEVSPVDQPLEAQGTTVCLGENAWLVATGSGTLTWYADAGATVLLTVSDSLLVISATGSATYYVVQEDGSCITDVLAVQLTVVDVPLALVINGPTSACTGDLVEYTTDAPAGTSITWTTPAGTFNGDPLSIPGAALSDAGTYSAVASAGACIGGSASLELMVYDPMPLDLGADTIICSDTTIVLQVPLAFTSVEWSTGASTHALTIVTSGTYAVDAIDPNGCAVTATRTITVEDCGVTIPNIVSPNGDGTNDAFVIDGKGGTVELLIYDRWGSLVAELRGGVVRWSGTNARNEPVSEGVYFFQVRVAPLQGQSVDRTGYLHVMR